jgi:glycogen debranching enzyme
MAELHEARGEPAEAAGLRAAACELRKHVEERYWLPDPGFYALALDGRKRPVETITSNPGQLLWTGLPALDRADPLARRLLAPDLFTGWGLRTLSSEHVRYNPLSYQRGSVWPHDTALAAAGLARYGRRAEAATLLKAILEAARAFEGDRLPELFCGFDRALGAPVPYREADVPQAWAAAVPILAVQLLLGLVPDAPANRCFLDPWLPDWLPELQVDGIIIGRGSLSVRVEGVGDETLIGEIGGSVEIERGAPPAALWGAPQSE